MQERIELAEEEAARSRAETDAARLEIDRLNAELATALQRAQAKRKTSAAVAAQARDAIGAECEERVREERARGAQEAALLREAAASDLASARAQHAAEMAAVAAERQGDAHSHAIVRGQLLVEQPYAGGIGWPCSGGLGWPCSSRQRRYSHALG